MLVNGMNEKKARSEMDGLSAAERETLEAICQAFEITVCVRTRRDSELIAIRHG